MVIRRRPIVPASIRLLFDRLFRRHRNDLLRFSQRQGHGAEAEDLVQDAFLHLLEQPEAEAIQNPTAYLYRSTRNLGTNHYRWEQVRGLHGGSEPVDPDSLSSQAPGPEAAAAGAAELERMLAVLDQLPELQRHAFLLHRLDGLSYGEVGKALGVSAKSAQRYVQKAFEHCLRQLGR